MIPSYVATIGMITTACLGASLGIKSKRIRSVLSGIGFISALVLMQLKY